MFLLAAVISPAFLRKFICCSVYKTLQQSSPKSTSESLSLLTAARMLATGDLGAYAIDMSPQRKRSHASVRLL